MISEAANLSNPREIASDDTAPIDLLGLTYSKLNEILVAKFGATPYRATQIFEWIFRKGIYDIDQMSNISRSFREQLKENFVVKIPRIHDLQISSDGTRKYLFEVENNELVESVMIKQPARMTLCVSSQVGCAMGCKFCRTALMGLKRNLSTAEIIGQVIGVIQDAKRFGDSFQNIVFMGMGEPLHNFNGVLDAVRILSEPNGLGMSPRKITVSTVGLVPAIKKLAKSDVDLSLAVSLNATTDEVRSTIMPINQRFPISELIASIKELPLRPRKKVTIEYVMLSGVNDFENDQARLVNLLHGLPVKVNLIPYNENAGLGYKMPSKEWVHSWQRSLNASGLQTTIRWSKGSDIKAACGQLATASGRYNASNEMRNVA